MYCESLAALALRQFHYCLGAVTKMSKRKNYLLNETSNLNVFEGLYAMQHLLENKEGK